MGALSDLVKWLLDTLAGLDPTIVALLTAAFAALETTALIGMVVPGDVVVLLAGSVAQTPARLALVFGAASLGTLAGELAGYAVGRLGGGRLRTSRAGRLVGERRWARAEAYLAGRGARVLVPIRFVSVLHALAPVVAGTVRMPPRRFLAWSAVGAAVWAGTYTALGAAAGEAYRTYGNLGLLVTVAVVAAVGIAMAVRSRRRARARQPTRKVRLTRESEASWTAPLFPVINYFAYSVRSPTPTGCGSSPPSRADGTTSASSRGTSA
jgi:membrane-associated protein